MADNIEHQDKGELVTNCDRFNSLKHSTVRSYAFTEQGEVMLQKCSLFPLFFQKSKNQKNNRTHFTN